MTVKRSIKIIFIMVILAGFSNVAARDILRGDICHIAAETTVDTNVFVLCRTLIIDGIVNGNLIGAASNAEINGTIRGDVYLIAGQLDVTSELGGDLHYAGPVLRIHPPTEFQNDGANLLSLTLSTTLQSGVIVPNSLIDVGYQLIVDGEVGGEVNFWGSALDINGIVRGDVDANVGDSESSGVPQLQSLLIPFPFDVDFVSPGMRLPETGQIEGRLRYSAPTEGIIAGEVGGGTFFTPETSDFVPAIPLVEPEQPGSREVGRYISSVVREMITLGFIGIVGVLIIPRYLAAPARNLQVRPLSNLALGLLSFIVSFPIVVIIGFVSALVVLFLLFLQQDNLAIYLAIVLGVIDLGGASIFYFVAIFIARVVVCLAIGRLLTRQLFIDDGSHRHLFVNLIPGVMILALFASLPRVGLLVNALAVFIGLGAILTTVRTRLHIIRTATPALSFHSQSPAYAASSWSAASLDPPLPETAEEARNRPPPIIPPIRPLGTDNLPEGFDWWDDTD